MSPFHVSNSAAPDLRLRSASAIYREMYGNLEARQITVYTTEEQRCVLQPLKSHIGNFARHRCPASFGKNAGRGVEPGRKLCFDQWPSRPRKKWSVAACCLHHVRVNYRYFGGSQKTQDAGYLVAQCTGSYDHTTQMPQSLTRKWGFSQT